MRLPVADNSLNAQGQLKNNGSFNEVNDWLEQMIHGGMRPRQRWMLYMHSMKATAINFIPLMVLSAPASFECIDTSDSPEL